MFRNVLCAMLIASSGYATSVMAAPIVGQISVNGYAEAIGSSGMASATGLDFVKGGSGSASPGVAGGLTSYGGGSGSFAGLACASAPGNCGPILDIASFATSAPIPLFLTFTTGTSTSITFDLSQITGITRVVDATGGSITLTASGTIHFTGLDDTTGVLSLFSQGNQVTSFSATLLASRAVATVPEPTGLALLGIGLVAGAAGLRRRRRAAA